jgi:methyl-accepting chemotaxis protein
MILKAANQSGLNLCSLAGDVRSPAQRNSKAARETRGPVGVSTKYMKTGAMPVAQTGQAIGGIVSPVPRVTALINELGSSSVEQSATSAHSKQARTDRLLEAVAVFRLNSNTGGL